jgi:hypothetical protein
MGTNFSSFFFFYSFASPDISCAGTLLGFGSERPKDEAVLLTMVSCLKKQMQIKTRNRTKSCKSRNGGLH